MKEKTVQRELRTPIFMTVFGGEVLLRAATNPCHLVGIFLLPSEPEALKSFCSIVTIGRTVSVESVLFFDGGLGIF